MSYDELNRMGTYMGPAGSECSTYRGAEWHRYAQSAEGLTRYFVYDGDNVMADIANGSVDAVYVTPFLDQNLSITRDSATHYYSQDGLGSVRTLTNSSGGKENEYDYLPFGGPYAPGTDVAVEQRYTYTGRSTGNATTAYYFRHRWMCPTLGRFIQRDPLGYRGRILSLYQYAGASPILGTDPFGLHTMVHLMNGGHIRCDRAEDDGDGKTTLFFPNGWMRIPNEEIELVWEVPQVPSPGGGTGSTPGGGDGGTYPPSPGEAETGDGQPGGGAPLSDSDYDGEDAQDKEVCICYDWSLVSVKACGKFVPSDRFGGGLSGAECFYERVVQYTGGSASIQTSNCGNIEEDWTFLAVNTSIGSGPISFDKINVIDPKAFKWCWEAIVNCPEECP